MMPAKPLQTQRHNSPDNLGSLLDRRACRGRWRGFSIPLVSHLSPWLAPLALVFGTQLALLGQDIFDDLEPTLIIATREERRSFETAGSSVSLRTDDLLALGDIDLVDALQREPGVTIPFDFAGTDGLVPFLQGGTNGINIRGLEGNRVNIMIDGIRQPEDFVARSFEGTGGPGRIYFDPAVFSQLEIFKSASSNLYGSDALAGTVMGRTEGPDTLLGPELSGSVFRSSSIYASKNHSFNQRTAAAIGNGRHALSFVHSYRVGNELQNNSSVPANPVDFDSNAVVVKSISSIGDWVITPTFDYFKSNAFIDLRSIQTATLVGENLATTSDTETHRTRFSLAAEWQPTEAFAMFDRAQLRPYWQSSRSTNFNLQKLITNPGAPNPIIRDRINDLSYQTDIWGADLSFNKALEYGHSRHLINYGYEFSISQVESALLRTDRPSPPRNLLNMAPAEVVRNGFFISDEITMGNRNQWVITPSVRLEHYRVTPENTNDFLDLTSFPVFDQFGRIIGTRSIEAQAYQNFAFAPGFNILYWLNESTNVYYHGSRGIRNPTAEELVGVFQHEDDFITLPNPSLRAESSFSNEIGIQRGGQAFNAQLAAYWNFYDDFLEPNVATNEFLDGRQIQRTENRNSAEIYGIEGRFDWRPYATNATASGFVVGGSFAWSRGFTKDELGQRSPLNTVEPWKTTLWTGYDDPDGRWGVNLTASYFAPKRSRDISGAIDPVDGYFLVDLVGHLRLHENLTIRGGLQNLLDEEYVLWARANRGSGHNGGITTGLDTQPGINGFLALELRF